MTRYIDADAVYKILESCEIRKATIGNPLTDWEYGYTCGIERAESEIECAPTIDAVPVRHGKWIHEVRYTIDSLHSYQQYRCSECGMTYITNTKYCPNCGADMRGEQDERLNQQTGGD